MLWLAIRFPHLPLNLFTRGQSSRNMPVAVGDTIERRERIIDCNPAALSGGVKPGMPLTAALGILSDLQIVERDPTAEQQALRRLAAWCYQYSSQVSIPEDRPGLFLEAGASQRLFGCPADLGGRIERKLVRLGYHAVAGSAPTPEAAWLAAPEGMHIAGQGTIRRQLGPLPLERLHFERTRIAAMERMGFRQLRDLLRLPRKTLTRRFGPALPDYLDRLLGVQADPRALFQPPEPFRSRLELPAEIHASQALLFPLRRLLEELCGVLRGGDTAVQSLRITLGHEDAEDSRLELNLQSPSQDPARLMTVLRERLERLRLPASVRDVRLHAPRLLRFSAGQHTLFRDTPVERQQDIEQLAERLQARLGPDAVAGLAGVEDHRPEYSWRNRKLDEPPSCTALAHRPAWLLPKPRRCAIENYEILAGPERIESGWWDGRDCRRDYFVVRDTHGSMLWAYHEYKPRRGWYLHGIFA
ncbi:MAG: DNA polymerase Y family protein [Xanthomonadales bacterium]|nr:DNA polymerase Y family protein [Xanthomonadales bacterium]